MNRRAAEWTLLCVFCAATPFVHFYMQLYWSIASVAYLPSVRGAGSYLAIVAQDAIGALLAAILVVGPLTWFTSFRPLVTASALTLSTLAVTVLMWSGAHNDAATALTLGEHLMFFLSCWAIATVIQREKRAHVGQ